MPAGHDFNALLLGALYGELSAVEESRLQAHLAAHPADHQLLRELTAIRLALRESAAFSLVEPPQAISARLLQEAARRAPRLVVEAPGEASRWWRFLSALLAHPGLAAATMAVLVVGVFGTMYLRDKHGVAESTRAAPSSAERSEAAADRFAGGQPAAAASAGASSPDRDDVSTDSKAAPAVVAEPRAAPPAAPAAEPPSLARTGETDSYNVDLDGAVDAGKREEAGAPSTRSKVARRPSYLEGKPADDIPLKDYADEASSAPSAPSVPPLAIGKAQPTRPMRSGPGTVSSTADLEVGSGSFDKNARLEAKKPEAQAAKKGASANLQQAAPAVPPADASLARSDDRIAPSNSKSSASPSPSASPPSPSPSPSPSSRSVSKSAPPPKPAPASPVAASAPSAASGAGSSSSAPPSGGLPAAPVPEAESQADSVSARESATASSLANDDDTARSEHVRLVRLARANKCAEAAVVARKLSERAPRYYQDQVANDRNLRACSAAIRDQLNLQSEQAKRKRARDSERPAPAPAKK